MLCFCLDQSFLAARNRPEDVIRLPPYHTYNILSIDVGLYFIVRRLSRMSEHWTGKSSRPLHGMIALN
jgi:hypothetical protein